ncbi:trans-aconitate 2-methyltransferase [Alcanivorax sp. DG881]|jgi:SAM-dependent methyltransferase|uniref:class I SAM-dependent methyltransferase n=1 Tax=Alcanivorax sp. DG881 TaxID=236097 RepID=UPI00017EE196|nr:class I SAM-dependent methyltransferase [Alcanivorax sp. DG881]EDX88106.1 Methyltransferase domain family [Alcanivorax sp. DG881]
MDPTETGKKYDTLTHLWESEKFNRQNGVEAHKRALQFVRRKGRALDVGCGCTGRFIDLLQEQGFTPEGVDISAKMLRLARDRHPDVTFHHQDICQWDSPADYAFITAWDSIWHVPLLEQENVITRLVNSLKAGGVLIFSFGGSDEPGDHRDDFMGPEMYYSSLGVNGFLALVSRLGGVCRHLEYDQYPELHTYMIVQKPEASVD